MSPRLFAALVAVLAAFGAAGMLAAQRDEPPPVRPTIAQAITVARDVPAIPAYTPAGGPPALAQRARRRPKRRHASPARPRPTADRGPDPAPATGANPARPAAPRAPAAPREPAPREDPPSEAPAPAPPAAAPVAPAPAPEIGEEAEEGTGEEVAPE